MHVPHGQVLSLEPADSDVSAPDILISPTTIGQLPSPPGGVAPRSRGTNAIPIVDMKMPGQVVISLRIAGVKLATFVNSTAALARAGHAGRGLPERDELVTLTEGSALQIEACAEMDVARGKVRGGTLCQWFGERMCCRRLRRPQSTASKPLSTPW